MNAVNSLESVFYISMPENFKLSDESFQIDTSIQLPVQKKIQMLQVFLIRAKLLLNKFWQGF